MNNRYPFECPKCGKGGDIEMPISEYDKRKDNIICECGTKMKRVFTPFGAVILNCQGFYVTNEKGRSTL